MHDIVYGLKVNYQICYGIVDFSMVSYVLS